MLDLTPVHTTGVNWDAVTANCVGISGVLFVVVGAATRFIRNGLRNDINRMVDVKIEPLVRSIEKLNTDMAMLKGIEEGKRFMTNQMMVNQDDRRHERDAG
jgi:hypothetical protein